MQFSTKDQDNDLKDISCAQHYKGAWWYNGCHWSNLNGLYLNGQHASHADGVNWATLRGHRYSLKRTEMKVKTKGQDHFYRGVTKHDSKYDDIKETFFTASIGSI